MQGKKPPWFVCFVWNIFLPVYHKIFMYMHIIDVFQIQVGKFNMSFAWMAKKIWEEKQLFNSFVQLINFSFDVNQIY